MDDGSERAADPETPNEDATMIQWTMQTLSHAKWTRKVRPRRGTSETICTDLQSSMLLGHTTHSGFILPDVKSLRSRDSPVILAAVAIAILIQPQFILAPINQCRRHAIRPDREPTGPSLGPGTTQKVQNALVKGQEKRAGRIQVFRPRSTRCLSISSRQSRPPTTSTPTPRSRPRAQSRSLCPIRHISPRFFLSIPRLPLRQSCSTRLSSSSPSTIIPTTDLSIHKSQSLVLLLAVICQLPSTASATSTLSSFSNPSRSTILPSTASFLHSAFSTARTTCLTSACSQTRPSSSNTAVEPHIFQS